MFCVGGLESGSEKTDSRVPPASKKKPKKKANLKARSATLESILDSLVTHTVGMEAPLAVQQRILDIVSDIDHEVGYPEQQSFGANNCHC